MSFLPKGVPNLQADGLDLAGIFELLLERHGEVRDLFQACCGGPLDVEFIFSQPFNQAGLPHIAIPEYDWLEVMLILRGFPRFIVCWWHLGEVASQLLTLDAVHEDDWLLVAAAFKEEAWACKELFHFKIRINNQLFAYLIRWNWS